MNDEIQRRLFDPTVGRLIASVVGIALITVAVRLASRSAGRYIDDVDARYRVRKLVTSAAYVCAILLLSLIYSNRLAGLTVAFGVAGAGIAFALQEVIASVAG